MIRPMNSARPNSRRASAPSRPTPTTSSDVTGSSAHERRVERTHQHLVERSVRHRGVGEAADGGELRRVLLDLVEHHDGVVQGEPEDGQERDDRRRRHLDAGHGVDADGDEDVVDDGGDRGGGHLHLEPDATGRARSPRRTGPSANSAWVDTFVAPAGADLRDRDRLGGDPAVLGERRGDPRLLRPAHLRGLDPDAVAAEDHDLRVTHALGLDQAADVAGRDVLARGGGELPRGPAGEVEPEVQAVAQDEARPPRRG